MPILVLKRKFGGPPSKAEITDLVVGPNLGDRDKGKEAIASILDPMKDLLAVYDFLDKLDDVIGRYADMLKEMSEAEKKLSEFKSQLSANDATFSKQLKEQTAKIAPTNKKLADLTGEVTTLEATRDALVADIEAQQSAKLELTKTVEKEYARTRRKLEAETEAKIAAQWTKVSAEESAVRDRMKEMEDKIAAAKKVLEDLAEEKRKFIVRLSQ